MVYSIYTRRYMHFNLLRERGFSWLIRFRFDAGQSHFDSLVRKYDAAVFRSASALVVAILIEAVLTVVASMVASCALIDINAALRLLDILVSTGTDADKASV